MYIEQLISFVSKYAGDSFATPEEGRAFIEGARKELKELRTSDEVLRALEAAGVDSWDGYDLALSERS